MSLIVEGNFEEVMKKDVEKTYYELSEEEMIEDILAGYIIEDDIDIREAYRNGDLLICV